MSAPEISVTESTMADPDDTSPAFDRRPWGTFHVLDEADTYKVKRITVDPGQRLSYQLHHRRAEHWVVTGGTARVTLDDVVHDLARGDSIDIPRGAKHRIENPGSDTLVFIEIQSGDYFGEDDIVRLDDDYGRQA
jgi:mannose-6-phosphate isomerase-like protein (cupin superfamily)